MVSIKLVDFIRDGILLIGAATAFGYITTPDNPFMTGVPAHPYFVVVVLMAARYGTTIGMGSAATLIVLYLLGGFAQPGDKSAFPALLEAPHSITVSGLFLFAVIVGGFSDILRRRLKDTEAQQQNDQERLQVLEKQNEILAQTHRELRNRIMEETTPLHTLFEMAQKLCTRNGQVLYSVVMEVLDEYLQAESCSFYLLKGNVLHLAACHGWDKVLEEDKIISVDHCPIIHKAIREKRVASLKDFIYREDLPLRDRIMAAPVCSKTDGKVIGVITIEKIPFEWFTPQTLRLLSLIADWTSKALAGPAYVLSERER